MSKLTDELIHDKTLTGEELKAMIKVVEYFASSQADANAIGNAQVEELKNINSNITKLNKYFKENSAEDFQPVIKKIVASELRTGLKGLWFKFALTFSAGIGVIYAIVQGITKLTGG